MTATFRKKKEQKPPDGDIFCGRRWSRKKKLRIRCGILENHRVGRRENCPWCGGKKGTWGTIKKCCYAKKKSSSN